MRNKAKRILTFILSLTLMMPGMIPVSLAEGQEDNPALESETEVAVILEESAEEIALREIVPIQRADLTLDPSLMEIQPVDVQLETASTDTDNPTEITISDDTSAVETDAETAETSEITPDAETAIAQPESEQEIVSDNPADEPDGNLGENPDATEVSDSTENLEIIPSAEDEPVQEDTTSGEIPIEPVDETENTNQEEPDQTSSEETEIPPEDEPVPENEPAPEDETGDSAEEPEEPEDELPSHQAGDFVAVSTDTSVFLDVDNDAFANRVRSALFAGRFVHKAAVEILDIMKDDAGNDWYKVKYLYGDTYANGEIKWVAYGAVYVLAEETKDTDLTACTVTDYALTAEQILQRKASTKRLLKAFSATAMNGFTLKNISVSLGSFEAWQSGLSGSSGKDSDYPQIAKSSAHGTIYATPHYLSGFTVFCLEHTLDGPGEGSGSNQAPKGPYVLVDMDTFCNTSAGGGVSGVRFSAKTMHALAWVLRHTYPFMVLDRSDSHNYEWSRVAGQFAMREVIKQLEGSQYVRSYWDMGNFYAFSGGAPEVYLTYARWLAANGIARSKVTGKITASNASLSISGSNYVGTVTLTTDADLIRIPKSVGTLTGNSGGSDSSYYYIKSGDTIKVTSSSKKFSVTMESISSDSEEANFLVGVPEVSIQKVLVPTYGSPYPLQEASVTFELKQGDIQVTKKSTDGILLKNTVFELLSGSTVIKTATTNASGVANFTELDPGTYTVREKNAPQGYELAATSSQNVTVVAGSTAKVEFSNKRISGKIRIVKTDSQTHKALAGATFTVTRLSCPESDNASDVGKVVATITTNAQGIAETGLLPWGQYKITETGVPDGYIDSGYTETVWIK